jgi:hypothetical protein
VAGHTERDAGEEVVHLHDHCDALFLQHPDRLEHRHGLGQLQDDDIGAASVGLVDLALPAVGRRADHRRDAAGRLDLDVDPGFADGAHGLADAVVVLGVLTRVHDQHLHGVDLSGAGPRCHAERTP